MIVAEVHMLALRIKTAYDRLNWVAMNLTKLGWADD